MTTTTMNGIASSAWAMLLLAGCSLPPWQIGKSFNVLLSEAKKEQPDNPVIAAMEPVDSGPDDIYAQIDANGLAGMARQLYTALD